MKVNHPNCTVLETSTVQGLTEFIRQIRYGENPQEWAEKNRHRLESFRTSSVVQAAVAHACNNRGIPLVWPWATPLMPNANHKRVLKAIRLGERWTANEDTVAVIVAARWAQFVNGGWKI